MVGEGWYMSVNIGSVTVNPPGCVGQYLHGGQGYDPAYFATLSRPHASHMNYAWQLKDVGPEDGGVRACPFVLTYKRTCIDHTCHPPS